MTDAPALLREPWHDLRRQRDAATFGIWAFLASEVLFFGALILAYTICRIEHPAGFLAAARETDIVYGTVNTAVLLTSSLAMAMASQSAEAGGNRTSIAALLGVTAALGGAFLVVKGFEYAEDIRHGLVPGPGFALKQPGAALFFALYWVMTGVHAVHLTIGIGLAGRLGVQGMRGRIALGGNPQVEVTALYWHLVDIVWIVLYPLIYLPGRSG
jgi:cytochrome c oxidase subunit III